MLALAASELASSEQCSRQLLNAALTHRTKSISALNAAIQRGVNSFEEGNAMLATCFSLLFQSTLIADGLVEYMTFMRGTIVLLTQMCGLRMRVLFDRTEEYQGLQPENPGILVPNDGPIIHPEIVAGACKSFEKFEGLCTTDCEIMLYNALYDIACSLHTASAAGLSTQPPLPPFA